MNRKNYIKENHCIHCGNNCKQLPECHDIWLREDLIDKLVNYWRMAENWYLETGKDTLKEKVKKIQDRLHLNCHEIKLLEEMCNNLGI